MVPLVVEMLRGLGAYSVYLLNFVLRALELWV